MSLGGSRRMRDLGTAPSGALPERDSSKWGTRASLSVILVLSACPTVVRGQAAPCERGYREAGTKCERIVVPENAKLDYLGHAWVCERGYREAGTKCERVVVPENAKLDYLGVCPSNRHSAQE